MDLMRGYVRSEVSRTVVVPEEIIQLCLIYYLIFEEWDENCKGHYINIVDVSKRIFKCTVNNYQSILASQVCSKGLHHWTLKLLEYTHRVDDNKTNWNNVVGVVDTDLLKDINYNTYLGCYDAKTIYFYIGWLDSQNHATTYDSRRGEQHKEYGESFKKADDVIDVYLDLNEGTLSYGINGTDYGVAFDDVDVDKEYRLFLIISGEGTSFQILSYDCE